MQPTESHDSTTVGPSQPAVTLTPIIDGVTSVLANFPKEVLRRIFLAAFYSPPPQGTIVSRSVVYPTGPDPIVVCRLTRVCWFWHNVVLECPELHAGIIFTTPLKIFNNIVDLPHDWPVTTDDLRHIKHFVAGRSSASGVRAPAYVRIIITPHGASIGISRNGRTMDAIDMLVECATTLTIHGSDGDKALRCHPLSLEFNHVRRLALDHIRFINYPSGDPDVFPLLSFLASCPLLEELVMFGVQGGPVHEEVEPVSLPHLRCLEFAGVLPLAHELLFHLLLQHDIELMVSADKDETEKTDEKEKKKKKDGPILEWSPNHSLSEDKQQKFQPLICNALSADDVLAVLASFPHIQALKCTRMELEASFFDHLKATSLPHLVHITLNRCTFAAANLKAMFRAIPDAQLPDGPLSVLTVIDCVYDEATDKLRSFVEDHLAYRVQWRVGHTITDHLRDPATAALYSEAKPLLDAPTPDSFYDEEGFTNWNDISDSDEVDSGVQESPAEVLGGVETGADGGGHGAMASTKTEEDVGTKGRNGQPAIAAETGDELSTCGEGKSKVD